MASVRYEFVKLGKPGGQNLASIITGVAASPAPATLAVSGSTAGPTIVSGAVADGIRLTAIDGPVHVTWGASAPTATLTNGIRLVADVPEVLQLGVGSVLAFINE